MRKALICLMILLAMVARAERQDSVLRPVVSAFALEVGTSHLCDTYLSPLKYNGNGYSLSYERLQAMRHNPARNVMRLDLGLEIDRTLNPARTAIMWDVEFRAGWSMMWRYNVAKGFTLAGGGNVGARVGALALLRNGNNPISAKAALNLGITGMAVWNEKLGPLPVTFRYQPTIPLAGMFFSPDYDELYYEIWLGNHSGLCHFGWPGNHFAIDNLLSADLHFGATTLRLGYRLDYLSTKASDIVSRSISHFFVIGVASEWISLRAGSRRAPDARIISALY